MGLDRQLEARYGESATFDRIIQCLDLIQFLRQSYISAKYKTSDQLPGLIKLTSSGQKYLTALSSKTGHPKEARLATFLEFFREEVLVDVAKTDIDGLRRVFSQEIAEGKLKHPFVQGPYLYETACDLFPDMRRTLSVSETRKLLDDLPAGVYQIGPWVSGPKGLIESSESRMLSPSMRIPLQHCPDVRCNRVHSVQLLSDPAAQINQVLRQVDDPTDDAIARDNDWETFLRAKLDELEESTRRPSKWTSLVWALGDLLTASEARELRISLEGSDFSGSGGGVLSPREFAEDFQLVLTHSDEDIIKCLDAMIFERRLKLDPSEVRHAKLNVRHNPFNPGTPQISKHGPRVEPGYAQAPLLRLRRLVEEALGHEQRDEREIAWILRNVDGESAADRVTQALETLSPRDLLRILAFENEESFSRACKAVDLHVPVGSVVDPRGGGRDDAFLDALMWSIGFDLDVAEDTTSDIRRIAGVIQAVLRDFHATATLDVERLRGAASNFYNFLEALLTDVVQFGWWAFTQDHIQSPRPFSYDSALGKPAWTSLNEHRSMGTNRVNLRGSEPAGLQAMVNGMDVLADMLQGLASSSPSTLRDPKVTSADKSGLTSVPFKHVHPFLDLLPEAQNEIIELLRECHKTLADAGVVRVRNRLLHFSGYPQLSVVAC